ncbi:MAG: methionyl-tRNA formyltransferase [Pseudomonadota bacterium]
MALRVVFMGAPTFSVPSLIAIIGAGHNVVAVYTQPPRPAGRRGLEETPTPVHREADALGIAVRTPKSLRDAAAQSEFRALDADVAVVVAYGLLLPKPILEAPRHGCLNFHPSNLPRWRGAAPLHRTVMAGDTRTAACVMRMEEGLDTGPVCLREVMPVGENMTTGQLHDLMAERGADLLTRALGALERGTLECAAQTDAGATYAAKVTKAETRIDWHRPAQEIHDHIRGLAPSPGAWFALPDDLPGKAAARRVKVLSSALGHTSSAAAPGAVLDASTMRVACGDGGSIELRLLQRAGRERLEAEAFARGAALTTGTILPPPPPQAASSG